MFQRIDIQNFGLFFDYKWKNSIGENLATDIFKKINIIYGRNYSGKTTLSRIFRWIETNEINENYSLCQFTITDENNNIISEKNIPHPNKIRVYNTDFVKKNLSWLYDNENGEIKPFTLLGSDNIAATNKISEIEKELGSIEKQTGLLSKLSNENKSFLELEKSLKDKVEKLDTRLKNHANQIIKTNQYYVQQGTNYIITNIKNDINHILANPQNYILDKNTKKSYEDIIDEKEKAFTEKVSFIKPNYEEYFTNVKLLIGRKIILSETIVELVSNSLLQRWVDEGRSLHKGKLEKCAFCDGELSHDRWEKLDAHFSKESEDLKRAIEKVRQTIESSIDYINSFFDMHKINRDNYYIILINEYDEIKTKWDIIANQYLSILNNLIAKLQERYDDIFNPKSIDKLTDIGNDFENLIIKINSLAEKNNSMSESINENKENARKSLRFSEISRFISESNYSDEMSLQKKLEKIISEKKVHLDDLNTRIKKLENEKKQEETKRKDEGEAAKKVNSHLLNFFGHDGLSLDPETINENIPETKFIIKRGNDIAHSLSEGECSLIAFCYFIAKMEDELNSAESRQLIIYIDDPISSLDNNHIFFMFSLIETVITKNKKFLQLFISTHNLDFLKYIKRLTISYDSNNEEQINHFLVEKRKMDSNYRCFLSKMPIYLRDYITEYNFLFKEVYNLARPFMKGERSKYFENNYTLFYNLPNNMRRFLECYLFYRFPNTDNPLKNLSKIFKGHIPIIVNRVVNEFSHLTWGDRGTLVMDIAEAEIVAKEIIRVIKDNDYTHFEALCESVKVDKNIAIGLPTTCIEVKAKKEKSMSQSELF